MHKSYKVSILTSSFTPLQQVYGNLCKLFIKTKALESFALLQANAGKSSPPTTNAEDDSKTISVYYITQDEKYHLHILQGYFSNNRLEAFVIDQNKSALNNLKQILKPDDYAESVLFNDNKCTVDDISLLAYLAEHAKKVNNEPFLVLADSLESSSSNLNRRSVEVEKIEKSKKKSSLSQQNPSLIPKKPSAQALGKRSLRAIEEEAVAYSSAKRCKMSPTEFSDPETIHILPKGDKKNAMDQNHLATAESTDIFDVQGSGISFTLSSAFDALGLWKEQTQAILSKVNRNAILLKKISLQEVLSKSSALFEEITRIDFNYQSSIPFLSKLRTYQKNGVNRALAAFSQKLGMVLSSDTGLGKTIQALETIRLLQSNPETRNTRFLIIVPVSIVENWKEEYVAHCFEKKIEELCEQIATGSDNAKWYLIRSIEAYYNYMLNEKNPKNIRDHFEQLLLKIFTRLLTRFPEKEIWQHLLLETRSNFDSKRSNTFDPTELYKSKLQNLITQHITSKTSQDIQISSSVPYQRGENFLEIYSKALEEVYTPSDTTKFIPEKARIIIANHHRIFEKDSSVKKFYESFLKHPDRTLLIYDEAHEMILHKNDTKTGEKKAHRNVSKLLQTYSNCSPLFITGTPFTNDYLGCISLIKLCIATDNSKQFIANSYGDMQQQQQLYIKQLKEGNTSIDLLAKAHLHIFLLQEFFKVVQKYFFVVHERDNPEVQRDWEITDRDSGQKVINMPTVRRDKFKVSLSSEQKRLIEANGDKKSLFYRNMHLSKIAFHPNLQNITLKQSWETIPDWENIIALKNNTSPLLRELFCRSDSPILEGIQKNWNVAISVSLIVQGKILEEMISSFLENKYRKKKEDYSIGFLNGNDDATVRKQKIDAFNIERINNIQGKPRFLIFTGAARAGIDLKFGDMLLTLDNEWSYANEHQKETRIVRCGTRLEKKIVSLKLDHPLYKHKKQIVKKKKLEASYYFSQTANKSLQTALSYFKDALFSQFIVSPNKSEQVDLQKLQESKDLVESALQKVHNSLLLNSTSLNQAMEQIQSCISTAIEKNRATQEALACSFAFEGQRFTYKKEKMRTNLVEALSMQQNKEDPLVYALQQYCIEKYSIELFEKHTEGGQIRKKTICRGGGRTLRIFKYEDEYYYAIKVDSNTFKSNSHTFMDEQQHYFYIPMVHGKNDALRSILSVHKNIVSEHKKIPNWIRAFNNIDSNLEEGLAAAAESTTGATLDLSLRRWLQCKKYELHIYTLGKSPSSVSKEIVNAMPHNRDRKVVSLLQVKTNLPTGSGYIPLNMPT